MARGTPLSQLRTMLAAEVGDSLVITNTNSIQVYNTILSNTQKWLGVEYDWPNLESPFDVQTGANARYLTMPNINWERPTQVYVKWNTVYEAVDVGIGIEEYNTLDPDQGQAMDPVQRWRIAEQIEVPPPLTAPTYANSGTGLTGVYEYAITYVTNFGETTVGPTLTTGTLANNGVALANIPLAPAGTIQGGVQTQANAFPLVTSRNIYRTSSGGSSFLFLHTIADNTTTAYTDAAADSTLGSAPPVASTAEVTAFEIWPVTVTSQIVRFVGQRLLSNLVNDTDTADLDDLMIVFFAAASMMARKKLADAQIMLQKAQDRLNKVRAVYPRRDRHLVFGGAQEERSLRRVVPMIVVAGNQSH